MNTKLLIDQVLEKFPDKKFNEEFYGIDPLFTYIVESLAKGADPFQIIQMVMRRIKEIEKLHHEAVTVQPVHYIVATEETIERMKQEKKILPES